MKKQNKIIFKTAFISIICSFFLFNQLSANQDSTKSTTMDSISTLNLDSNPDFVTDSVNSESKTDPTIIYKPNPKHGLIDYSGIGFGINKSEIQKINYIDLNDIILEKTNAHTINLGYTSLPVQLNYLGGLENNNNILINGASNPINLNSFNLLNINSPEGFEKIEIFEGSAAILRGNNSNGLLMNIVEINYDISEPYTRLWLAESAGDLMAVDGIFSQNIYPNINLSIGFKNMSGDGIYQNNEIKNLNFRTKLKYFISDISSISLSYNFYNLYNALNGGLDKDKSIDQNNNLSTAPNDAFVYFTSDFNQRLAKADLLLTYSDNIKSNEFTLNFFTNENGFDYLKTIPSGDSTFKQRDRFYNEYSGISLNSNYQYDKLIKMNYGFDLISNSYKYYENNFSYSAYYIFNLELNKFKIEPGIRLYNNFNRNSISYGSKFIYDNKSNNKIDLDVSLSEKQYLQFDNIEQHILTLINHEYSSEELIVKSTLFYRQILNPLELYLDNTNIILNKNDIKNVYGFNLVSNFKLLNSTFFENDALLSRFRIKTNLGDIEYLPSLVVDFNLNWNYKRGRSKVKIGFNYSFSTSFIPLQFNPLDNNFLIQNENNDNYSNQLDLFILLKLGHAHLKVNFISLLNTDYYSSYLYPYPSNYLKISASWTITP